MAPKATFLKATFQQVLLYADGPQIVLLSAIADTKIVGIAIAEEKGYAYPFFGAQVTNAQFDDYLNEKFDLRYLLSKPDRKRNFLFDLAKSEDGNISLVRTTLTSDNISRYLPDPGVFSRTHSEEFENKLKGPSAAQRFYVDGSWDLSEFSKLYGSVTDLYAFFDSADIFLNVHAPEEKRLRIQSAFNKPFEGGGSYVSLFDSLALAQPRENRLRVDGIQYASPGHIQLRGHVKTFNEVKQLLQNIDLNGAAIKSDYRSLHGTLKKLGLLRDNSQSFSLANPNAEIIKIQANELSRHLDVVDFDSLQAMANQNILIVAKVLLSICRRADRLSEFFREGRVSFDMPTSQALPYQFDLRLLD